MNLVQHRSGGPGRSVDVDGLTTGVPAAVAAHDVGQLARRCSAGRGCGRTGASVQLEARRLRLLALEVFFFGTAMVVSTASSRVVGGRLACCGTTGTGARAAPMQSGSL